VLSTNIETEICPLVSPPGNFVLQNELYTQTPKLDKETPKLGKHRNWTNNNQIWTKIPKLDKQTLKLYTKKHKNLTNTKIGTK
jgi:hypothetical protein